MSSSTLYFLTNSITCLGTKIENRVNFLFGLSNCAHLYMSTVHPINVYGTLFHNFFLNRSKLGAIFPSNLSQNGISFKFLHIVRNDLDVHTCFPDSCFRHAVREVCVGIHTVIIHFPEFALFLEIILRAFLVSIIKRGDMGVVRVCCFSRLVVLSTGSRRPVQRRICRRCLCCPVPRRCRMCFRDSLVL